MGRLRPAMILRIARLAPALGTVLTDRSTILFQPVNSSFLTYFRIVFGGIMLWETWRFIKYDWVAHYFSGKDFYFTYWPFDFLQPWPQDWMYVHLVVMGIFAGFILLGFLYRISAIVFFLMITYIFLLEQARYLNHLYLVCLVSFLMIFLPANRYFSVDALLRPSINSPTVPAWSWWLLRFQIAVPMLFGGIAKLNSDWLQGEPLRAWLAVSTDFPLLGQFFTNEILVRMMVYGSLLVDLLFIFYMLHRRTRLFGFILVLVFHLLNARLFEIGIFPWFMIAATLIYFAPDWPKRVLQGITQGPGDRWAALALGMGGGFLVGGLLPRGFELVPAVIGAISGAVVAYHWDEPFLKSGRTEGNNGHDSSEPGTNIGGLIRGQKWTLALLGLWVGFQVLVPLRHLAIPGLVHWTEEGHNFSWHMKLRDKSSEGFFIVTDPSTRQHWVVDPREHLTSWQVFKMTSRPDMIVQFAHHLEELARAEGRGDVEVRAQVVASLNGRPAQNLVDPNVDLTRVSRPWFGHAGWIVPLEAPLTPGY